MAIIAWIAILIGISYTRGVVGWILIGVAMTAVVVLMSAAFYALRRGL